MNNHQSQEQENLNTQDDIMRTHLIKKAKFKKHNIQPMP